MKIIRVPWIQCRADEVDAQCHPFAWQGRDFEIMAYSEGEARRWWSELPEQEKNGHLGLGGNRETSPGENNEELLLF